MMADGHVSSDPDVTSLLEYHDSEFTNKKFSDFTIRCQGREFFVHRVILAARSAFFNKAFNPTSLWTEAKTGTMDLEEDDPDIVHQMLCYCYCPAEFQTTEKFKLSLMNEPRPDVEAKLKSWILLHALADRFLIEGLKTKIIRHFELMINASGFRYYICGGDFKNNRKHLSPAGVGRIARAVFETTHERDTRLRTVTLSLVSLILPMLGASSRFVAEVSRIEDFWMLLAMNHAKVDFRARTCPSCCEIDVAELREHSLFEDMSLDDGRRSHKKFNRGKFQCDSCNALHTVDEWNALHSRWESDIAQILVPWDSEDEESIDSRGTSKKRRRVG
ncbi:uncharacterized protein J3D65DRAFT_73796 [Phyllosticta citribraziliensis]|uniref:BTB domain-containing protein n=1 Tax=Phyllosticta citribraziliensis TaxID=989973 RepID=A0ABR1LD86_9PEZI